MKKRKRRLPSEVNAGSMADIAFLLLIFFLVATTILEDQGILVKLPPWQGDVTSPPASVTPRNLLSIKINAKGLLLVRSEEAKIAGLRDIAKEFITNPMKRSDLPSAPNKAIISLQNDRGTPYKSYLSVYNEIKGAYNEVWSERALQQFQKPYADLLVTQQRIIRSQWPQIISEAEPTAYGE